MADFFAVRKQHRNPLSVALLERGITVYINDIKIEATT